jgi:hypothetical protein
MKQHILQEQSFAPNLGFVFEQEHPTFAILSIVVPQSFVNDLFKAAAFDQKNVLQAVGFNKGEIPLEYIKQNHARKLLVV